MEKKKKYLFGIGIVIVLLSVIGISYAYWMINLQQTGENFIATSCFDVRFEETVDSSVNLTNAFPLTDEEGEKLDSYKFTVTNKCKNYAKFNLQLEVNNTSTLDSKYIKIKLNENAPKILNTYPTSDNFILKNTDEGYILDMDYLDAEESRSYNLRLWLDENVTIDSKNNDGSSVQDSTWKGFITLSASYTDSKETVLAGKTIPIVEEGNGLYEVKHDDVTGTLNDTGFQKREYRYAGENPDNYVWFNCDEGFTSGNDHCEKWRIIGLVNVKTEEGYYEQRLKLVRNESIGTFNWDYKEDKTHSNDWKTSTLMKLLNEEAYYNSSEQTIAECIGTSQGTCTKSNSRDVDFTSTGLKDSVKKQIEKVYWNLGPGNGTNSGSSSVQYYQLERTGDELLNSVGLMLGSDYGYATSGGSIDNRKRCLEEKQGIWNIRNENSLTDCKDNDWIYNGMKDNTSIWLILKTINSLLAAQRIVREIAATNPNGSIANNEIIARRDVYPTLYLNSNVKIVNDMNNGSNEMPYQLSIE